MERAKPSSTTGRPTTALSEDSELDALVRAVAYAPPQPGPPEVIPGTRWGTTGRYVIRRRLGRGGMGTVYAAYDDLLRRDVAVKVLHVGDGREEAKLRARLLREAQIAAQIESERIARVYDVGEHDGSLFVAMEFVSGETLRHRMSEDLGSLDVVTVALQMAEGLAGLHARGVVHRDLKPENVMLTAEGGVKLLDFGVAQATAFRSADAGVSSADATAVDAITVRGVAGTPGYMAPEQCAGQPGSPRVDVFALGVIVYELVEGRCPFVGPTKLEILQATVHERPSFTDEAWLVHASELRPIVERALSKDPGNRFADGGAVLQALRPLAPIAEQSAPPPSRRTSSSPGSERSASVTTPPNPSGRRRQVVLAGSMTALVAALAVGALVIARRAREAKLPEPPPGMAWVHGGAVTIGHSTEELDRECKEIGPKCLRPAMQREVPKVIVAVEPFLLDVDEVSNEQMAGTLDALSPQLWVENDDDGHTPKYVRWKKSFGPPDQYLMDLDQTIGGIEYAADRFHAKAGLEHHPVGQVTWHGAREYCRTRGKVLPTENEWEAAARGTDGRVFPWGNAPIRCGDVIVPNDGFITMSPACPAEIAIANVGTASQDVTPEGIRDLAGNMSEWVDSAYVEGLRVPDGSGADDLPKLIRGGSFGDSFSARTSGRFRRPANSVGLNVGFRCAVRKTMLNKHP